MKVIADLLAGFRSWAVVNASCLDVLPLLPPGAVDHFITDPPYDERIEKGSRSLRAFGNVKARAFGYAPLSRELRAAAGAEIVRLCRRWALVFCDVESAHLWGRDLPSMKHVRTGAWIREYTAPQFTGDRPAAGFEAVVIKHASTERPRWNGGGAPAVWAWPIVNGTNGCTEERFHTTQKPIALMLDLVAQFTDPGDLVCDPFNGGGTTGAACVRLGRRYLGIELNAEFAARSIERIEAEGEGLTVAARRARQIPMFPPRSLTLQ